MPGTQNIDANFAEFKGQLELLKLQIDSSSKKIEKFANTFDGSDPNSFSNRILDAINKGKTEYEKGKTESDQRYADIDDRLSNIETEIRNQRTTNTNGTWIYKTTIIAALITGLFSCIGHIINWNKQEPKTTTTTTHK